MTKKIDDWLDDVPENNENDEDDEIIWVSKSEIKRDAEALKDLGAELVDLGKNSLDKLPLDDTLHCQYAYHMMYGRKLPFLQRFAARDAQTSEGYGMLIGQAALSFESWTGHKIDVAKATEALSQNT